MGRILLSIVLGLFAPFVAFMAAALVEVPGQNPPQERIAAGLAAFLYLAICQFLVTRRDNRRPAANWPTMVALGVPLLLLASVADARNLGERAFLYGPWVIAGWLGIAVGAWAARRVTLPALSFEYCRRCLLACAVVMGVVTVVIAAGVTPMVAADTDPRAAPPNAVLSWGGFVLSLLVAASLALAALRAGRGRRPSPIALGVLGFLALVLAVFGAPAVVLFTHGPAMRLAAILGVLCSAAEFVVAVAVGAVALRLPAAQTA